MSQFSININGIIASVVNGNRTMNSGDAIILDPITDSYSSLGTLNFYEFTILDLGTVTLANVLNNGKNSRFTAEGSGNVIVQLEVKDDQGNSDTTNITITVV